MKEVATNSLPCHSWRSTHDSVPWALDSRGESLPEEHGSQTGQPEAAARPGKRMTAEVFTSFLQDRGRGRQQRYKQSAPPTSRTTRMQNCHEIREDLFKSVSYWGQGWRSGDWRGLGCLLISAQHSGRFSYLITEAVGNCRRGRIYGLDDTASVL